MVQGEAALNRIQKKIDNLYKTVGDLETKKKFQGSQAAASFVREQANELERVVSVSKQQIKEQERSIVKQSKLNAAVDLYERRQRQLSRTSVANQKQFADQIRDIEEGFKFFKDRKSATGVQAIATELGRIIEYDNEINRISERRTANQRRLFAFSKEIARYEAFGLKTDRARKTLSSFEEVAGGNQLKKAQQYEAALRNQLKLLKDQLVEQQRVAKIAPSSPILGGVNFPGSPKAVAAQQRAQEIALRQAQRGFPASPIGGAVTMIGSPKFLAAQERARSAAERALRAQEKSAKAAENAANKEADRILKESQKGFPSSPIMGAVSMAGSPRAIAAQERNRAAAEKRAAVQRRAEERAAKVQQQVAVAAERAAEKALKEAQKGFPSSPILGSATVEGSPRWRTAQESARQKLESAAKAAERAADRALKEAQKGFPSSPILGTATMTGSPKWKAAQEKLARAAAGGGVAGSGLEQALQGLQEARGARQSFLGGVSPAQAIDQIVREFRKGQPAVGNVAQNIGDTFATSLKKGASEAATSARSFATAAAQAIKNVFGIASPSRFMIELVQNLVNTYIAEMQKSYPRIQAATDKAFGEQTLLRSVKELRATGRGFEFAERPSRGFRPFREAQGFGRGTEGATQEFNNMMLDFRKQIAELTTQPEIFSNLLRGLPDARITTDLIGAANRRALASELPSFMPTQRMMGPGELEKAITNAFSKFVRELRVPTSERIRAERFAGPKLLTPAVEIITPSQQERIARAYERSAQRALSVLAEDAFRGAGRPAISAANFGFMADPARISRLSGIGRALPPAIDVASSAVDGESRDLRESIRNLFDRINQGIQSAFSGFGGFGGGSRSDGGGAANGGGGRGGAPNQVAQLLGFDAIGDISRVSTRELEALSAAASELRAVLDPTIEGFDRLDNQLRETIGQIGRQIERRAPEADFLTRRFGPRGGRAVSEGLIGGAFPLLFGQGVGAAAGGGLGGALGGFAGGGLGFGLSLAGTALGTAFDTLNQAAQDTGKALRYPIEGFEKLKEAGLLAGREQEYYISKLIEAGRATEAAGIIQAEIIKKIGVRGVEDLQRLGDSSSRLSKAWAEFTLQLQAALAGPMAGLLNWLANTISVINNRTREVARQSDITSGLSPNDLKSLQAEEQRILSGANIFNEAAKRQQVSQLYSQFESRANINASTTRLTPEQLDAQKKAEGATKELQAQVELQSKQLSLTGLTLERDEARYVNAAKAVAIQEYDNKLLEIKNSWIGQIFNKEQNLAKIRNANLQLAAQLKQINEEVARRQEEVYQNSLQAEMALYQEAQKQYDLNIKITEFNQGEIAALKERLSRNEQITNSRLAEFYVEEELAMIAARKNGTVEQTAKLYSLRLKTLQSELDLEKGVAQQKIAQLQLDKLIAIEEAKRQAADPFAQFRQSQQLNEQFTKTYFRLLKEGIKPAEAERLANFERLVSEQLRSLDIQVAIAQSVYDEAVARGILGKELQSYLDNLERAKAARDSAAKEAAGGPGPASQEVPGAKIQEFISTAEEELKDLEALAVRVSQGIGDAVANSMANGITGLIEGTTTAKEVFAGFLKDMGNILIKEGTRMIGMYIAIGVAKMFAGLLSGAGGASKPALPGSMGQATKTGLDTGAGNISDMLSGLAANGAYFANGVSAFAKGGMFTNSVVASPTLFKFADGGVQRTGLMGEAGPEAIMPLRRSANGRLGVDANGLREAMASGGSGSSGASVLNMSFQTTSIGGVEYVSREQLEAAMAATRRDAARDGAKRGMSMTLDKLQQSPGTRGRVGLR